jgi:hypothetical protein
VLPGWITYTHPEGALYFYHQERVCDLLQLCAPTLKIHLLFGQSIFTDAWIYDPDILTDINHAAEQILSRLQETVRVDAFPAPPELALELNSNVNGETTCGYYFADSSTRYLFWLEQYDAGEVCSTTPVVSLSHLGAYHS